MAIEEVAALLRLLAKLVPGELAAKALNGALDPSSSQRTLNEIAPEVLKARDTLDLPRDLIDKLVDLATERVTPPEGDYNKGPFGTKTALPRVRCRPDQLERFNRDMKTAGFDDPSTYIRFKLFA